MAIVTLFKLSNDSSSAVCLTCLKQMNANEALSIHHNFEGKDVDDVVTILKAIEDITRTKVQYVKNHIDSICNECLVIIESISNFRRRCKLSQRQIVDNYILNGNNCKELNNEREIKKCDRTDAESTVDHLNNESDHNENCEENESNALANHTDDNGEIPERCDSKRTDDRIQSEPRRIACELCGKTYKHRSSLKFHARVAHLNVRPYLCSRCGKRFRKRSDLRYHTRTHTNEKPYVCNYCGKSMSISSQLVLHTRIHTGEKPFKCRSCQKAFISSSQLKRHEIVHGDEKPYACNLCDKSFNRRNNLTVHKRIHTNERPHLCPICNKSFAQSQSLKRHQRNHYGYHSNEKSI